MNTVFFTEQQLDRINLKTMATPLPGSYTGNDLMALLVTRAKSKRPSLDEWVIQDTVEWYCRAKPYEVDTAFDKYKQTELFQGHLTIITMMHEQPEALERALEAIEKGWRPGDPK